MTLINVLAFLVLKIIHNLVCIQKSRFLQVTAEVSKISKSALPYIIFNFYILTESVKGFL